MAYFNKCPRCGCHLDPGEKCDCIEESNEKQQLKREMDAQIAILQETECSQLKLQFC